MALVTYNMEAESWNHSHDSIKCDDWGEFSSYTSMLEENLGMQNFKEQVGLYEEDAYFELQLVQEVLDNHQFNTESHFSRDVTSRVGHGDQSTQFDDQRSDDENICRIARFLKQDCSLDPPSYRDCIATNDMVTPSQCFDMDMWYDDNTYARMPYKVKSEPQTTNYSDYSHYSPTGGSTGSMSDHDAQSSECSESSEESELDPGAESDPEYKPDMDPLSESPVTSAKPKTKKKRRGLQLWQFLLQTLNNPEYNPCYIKWLDRKRGIFKFVNSKKVAQLWGKRRKNSKMSYEYLSRAMRHYYARGIMSRVEGRRLTYKFESEADGWQE